MVGAPGRGQVWWAETEDKRRPVLILTREAAIPVMKTLLVAPVTRRVRQIPTQVLLDADDGMPVECAVSLDNVTVADPRLLTGRITQLSAARMSEVCRALATAVGC